MMDSDALSDREQLLLERLRRLEQSQRRYRSGFLALAALGVMLSLTGAKAPVEDLVQAKTIEIVDDNSQVVARLGSAGGAGSIQILRPDGTQVATMGSSADGTGRLETFNAEGKTAVLVATNTQGNGMVLTNNAFGKLSVLIGGMANKDGGISIYNSDEKRVGFIGVDPERHTGLINTFDATGKAVTGHLP